MKSLTSTSFRKHLAGLSPEVKRRAIKQFRLWLNDHWHPSLHFKRVGPYWSARVDRDHRALGIERDGAVVWFFIGRHDDYDRLL
jgi:hypothetical protein